MAENETMIETTIPGDEDDFMPDGWQEGMRIEDLGEVDDGKENPFDGGENLSDVDFGEDEDGKEETPDPTTDGEEAKEPVAAEETAEPGPDGDQTEKTPVKRMLKLRVDHADEDVDVNAMTDEELIEALQKSRAYDRKVRDERKATFRSVYQQELDAGMTERAAMIAARDAAGGETFSLEDTEEEPVKTEETVVSKAPAPAEPTTQNLTDQLKALQILYPNAKDVSSVDTLPDAVKAAVRMGTPAVTAYSAYRENLREEAVAKLRKENQILKQNAAAAAKAPGTSVTGGAAVGTPKKKDPLLEGFDKELY